MRSDILKRHEKSCHHSQFSSTPPFNVPSLEERISTGNNKRVKPSEIISDSGLSDETDQHQNIQKSVNEIINDDVTSAAEVSSSPLERFDQYTINIRSLKIITIRNFRYTKSKEITIRNIQYTKFKNDNNTELSIYKV